MSALHFANSKDCPREVKGAAMKRRLPSYGEGVVSLKENRQAPSPAVPKRTKRQKISKTPPAKVSLLLGGWMVGVGKLVGSGFFSRVLAKERSGGFLLMWL